MIVYKALYCILSLRAAFEIKEKIQQLICWTLHLFHVKSFSEYFTFKEIKEIIMKIMYFWKLPIARRLGIHIKRWHNTQLAPHVFRLWLHASRPSFKIKVL